MRHNEDIDNAPRGPRPLRLEDALVDMHRIGWRAGLSIVLMAGLAVLAAVVLFR